MWAATDQGPASDPGPNPLRAQAARVAISLLGADVNDAQDGVGVVLFGSADRPGDDIVVLPVTELSSNAAREALYARIDESLWSKGFTRIDRALSSCLVVLGAAQPQPAQARIVLVTDGVPQAADPRYDANGQLAALTWTLDELSRRGWHVDVILLGSTAQSIADDPGSFANRIAGATSGQVYVAAQRTDLLHIYTSIVASMTGRTLVSGDPIDLAKSSSVPVQVEERTAEMTVTVVKSDIGTTVELFTPDGADANGQITRTSTGLVETLTVQEPTPGVWSLRLLGAGQAYVSLVLKPAANVPPTPPTQVAPAGQTTNSHATGGLFSFPMTAVELLGAVLVAALVSWGLWRCVRADRFVGIVTVRDARAKVVRLADLERPFRVLGMYQRPIPLTAVAAALGLEASNAGALTIRGGALVIVAADGRVTPVTYGKAISVETEPPTDLLFARSAEELPRIAVKVAPLAESVVDQEETPFAEVFSSPTEPGIDALEGATQGEARAATPAAATVSPSLVLAVSDKYDDVW